MHLLECVLFPRRIYNEICDIDFISLLINIYTENVAGFVYGSSESVGKICDIFTLYISRMLPALFMDRVKVSGKFAIFLHLIPYTVMASLIFPTILYIDKNIWIGILASVVAVIAALKNLPVIGVVLSSVISCVIFYMFILS